ncbi:MAG TPA: hypothetical protein VEB63_03635 [Chitinophagaceae bacterium]|nr:hypothetical protein [Chitinophagaceae bacterium]
MKNSLHISASFDKPDFVEQLVEQLAQRRIDHGYGKEQVPCGLKAVDSSSTEAYVSGDLAVTYLDDAGRVDRINMPFITCFLFTCVKPNQGAYGLAWGVSLS